MYDITNEIKPNEYVINGKLSKFIFSSTKISSKLVKFQQVQISQNMLNTTHSKCRAVP